MRFFRDGKDQLCLEWSHWPGDEQFNKRAWIQYRQPLSQKDWANSPEGRYVIVASLTESGNPLQGPDFPVFSTLSDKEILIGVANAFTEVTGVGLPDGV